MKTTDQIDNPTKDQYIERKIEEIKKSIQKYGYDQISTCNSFSYGWSREDYLYMDDVASKLRQMGVTVRKEMKFGVMDYYFS
jgi:H2-forming N5,N10-methylenetetrahydromethanopterin dehydrogenase-like enzyme